MARLGLADPGGIGFPITPQNSDKYVYPNIEISDDTQQPGLPICTAVTLVAVLQLIVAVLQMHPPDVGTLWNAAR